MANHAALSVRNLRSVEELTYLKTYLEDLIEHANALICVASRAREVIVWNAALARLTGVAARRGARRASLLARVPPEDHGAVEAVLARGFAGETVDGFETRLARPRTGGEARIAVNTAPIFGACGRGRGGHRNRPGPHARALARRPPRSTPSGSPASAGSWRASSTSSTTRSPR